jgi:hypothetical protein
MARSHRTYWIVRRRYRRAGYVGSVVTMMLSAFWVVPIVHGAEQPLAGSAAGDLAGALAILLIAALVPVVLARLCWRLHRQRYFEDMYTPGLV